MKMWPEDRSERLVALWNEGKSASMIAAELGVSRNAVAGRIHRLRRRGAKIKEHEYKPEGFLTVLEGGKDKTSRQIGSELGISANAVRQRAHRLRRKGIPLEHRPIPKLRFGDTFYFPKPKPLPVPRFVDTLEGSVEIMELTGCKWPVTAAGVSPHRFCNKEQLGGSSYCEHHKARSVHREMKLGKYEVPFQ